jgi:hypothetical protein
MRNTFFVVAGAVLMAVGHLVQSGLLFSFGTGMFLRAAMDPWLRHPGEDRQ